MSTYESDCRKTEQLFQELQPLYLNLHAYVRRALYRFYGPELIDLRGPSPPTSWVKLQLAPRRWGDGLPPPLNPAPPLLWNMGSVLGQHLDLSCPSWRSPEDITKIMKGQVSAGPRLPCPPHSSPAVGPTCCPSQHWKPEKMFQEAEKFFTPMGLLSTPPEFWENSMMERPTDWREVEAMPCLGLCQREGLQVLTLQRYRPFLAPSALLPVCLSQRGGGGVGAAEPSPGGDECESQGPGPARMWRLEY